MPIYRVLSSSDDIIKVCSLLCYDEEHDRTVVLKVKEMTGENGSVFVDKMIEVTTTNREIIPADIRFAAPITPWAYPTEESEENERTETESQES